MSILQKLKNLGRAKQPTPTAAQLSAEYVPTPKAKDPAAMHPLVREKLMNPGRRARGVGIVYGKDGKPKITRDWLDNLSPEDRRAADINLAAHGWKVGTDNTIMRA